MTTISPPNLRFHVLTKFEDEHGELSHWQTIATFKDKHQAWKYTTTLITIPGQQVQIFDNIRNEEIYYKPIRLSEFAEAISIISGELFSVIRSAENFGYEVYCINADNLQYELSMKETITTQDHSKETPVAS